MRSRRNAAGLHEAHVVTRRRRRSRAFASSFFLRVVAELRVARRRTQKAQERASLRGFVLERVAGRVPEARRPYREVRGVRHPRDPDAHRGEVERNPRVGLVEEHQTPGPVHGQEAGGDFFFTEGRSAQRRVRDARRRDGRRRERRRGDAHARGDHELDTTVFPLSFRRGEARTPRRRGGKKRRRRRETKVVVFFFFLRRAFLSFFFFFAFSTRRHVSHVSHRLEGLAILSRRRRRDRDGDRARPGLLPVGSVFGDLQTRRLGGRLGRRAADGENLERRGGAKRAPSVQDAPRGDERARGEKRLSSIFVFVLCLPLRRRARRGERGGGARGDGNGDGVRFGGNMRRLGDRARVPHHRPHRRERERADAADAAVCRGVPERRRDKRRSFVVVG